MAVRLIAEGKYCRHLRSKGMFIEIEPDLGESGVPSMTTGFVWCVHSQNCLGPDGRVAEYATCVRGRSCHED